MINPWNIEVVTSDGHEIAVNSMQANMVRIQAKKILIAIIQA